MCNISVDTRNPPAMEMTFANSTSSGIISTSAIRRGSTRNSMGLMPNVWNASISWLTFMVPSWAAKAAPVRPQMMIPVMMQPISRTVATATRSAV
jgi:hypothetical protein